MLLSSFVQRVGASHRVKVIVLHSISEKELPTEYVPIIFAIFCFISRNHGLACSRL